MQCNAKHQSSHVACLPAYTYMCGIDFKKTPSKSEKSTRAAVLAYENRSVHDWLHTHLRPRVCVVVYKIQKRHKHTHRERERETKATNAIVHPCESIN